MCTISCARPKHFLARPIIVVIVLAPVLVYALEMTHASFPSQPTKCSAPFLVSSIQMTHHIFSFLHIYQRLTSMHASKVCFHSHVCDQDAPWIVTHCLAHPYPYMAEMCLPLI
jgi:hypothetical protein